MLPMDELDVICTDRGTHPPRTLATFLRVEHPETLLVGDHVIQNPAWPGHTWSPVHYRWTRAGFTTMADYTPGRVLATSDGGTKFVVPGCLTCKRAETELRDDTLTRYWDQTADTPLRGVLDVSLGVM